MKSGAVYPKLVRENLLYRNELLTACQKDKSTLVSVLELAKRDVLFYFNTFLWAEDPFADKNQRHGIPQMRFRPIVTYPFQDEFILDLKNAISGGEDIIADKSRDMLATYMVLGVFLHGWLFSGHKYMISSWKEDEIDGKDDTSTLFGKIRLNLRLHPDFLLGGFEMKRDSSYMMLRHPNGGTIVGSAASPNLASGRREDAIFTDELSKWLNHSHEAWTSISDATKCKIGVWTPRGSANKAAELMNGSEVKRKHHLLWYKHPEKCFTSKEHLEFVRAGKVRDKVGSYTVQLSTKKAPSGCYVDQNGKIRSEWYDDECEKRDKDDVAENLDCNYLTSGNPVFDTSKCQRGKMSSEAPRAIGNLIWRIHPKFSERGECVNQNQLSVEFVENSNGNVLLWEYPKANWENGYLISADCAEGLEQGDYDSARVLRRFGEKPKIVASLHAHMKPFEYAEELAKLGTYFGNACIAVEREGHSGGAVIETLRKIYRNLFHKEIMTKGYPEMTDRIGWFTTAMTKPVIIGFLSKAISESLYDDPDEAFWNETLTFVNNDGKLEAQGKSQGQKCFDDRVMAEAIVLWVNSQVPLPAIRFDHPKMKGWRKSWDEKPKGDLIRFAV